jgi:hypothetical protein
MNILQLNTYKDLYEEERAKIREEHHKKHKKMEQENNEKLPIEVVKKYTSQILERFTTVRNQPKEGSISPEMKAQNDLVQGFIKEFSSLQEAQNGYNGSRFVEYKNQKLDINEYLTIRIEEELGGNQQ